jgi:hypothetical protein
MPKPEVVWRPDLRPGSRNLYLVLAVYRFRQDHDRNAAWRPWVVTDIHLAVKADKPGEAVEAAVADPRAGVFPERWAYDDGHQRVLAVVEAADAGNLNEMLGYLGDLSTNAVGNDRSDPRRQHPERRPGVLGGCT